MTGTVPAVTAPLQEWLDALVAVDEADRTMLGIEGLDAGIGFRKVRCTRHGVALNWQSAVAHLRNSEASHRLQHGPGARLHERGDLVEVAAAAASCSRCRARVLWAVTQSGGLVALDADPNPGGTFVVAANPAAPNSRPLAVALHTETERAAMPAGSVHTAHAQTCAPRAKGGRR
jgi:hypothetical protein